MNGESDVNTPIFPKLNPDQRNGKRLRKRKTGFNDIDNDSALLNLVYHPEFPDSELPIAFEAAAQGFA